MVRHLTQRAQRAASGLLRVSGVTNGAVGRGEEGRLTAHFLAELGVERNGGHLSFDVFIKLVGRIAEEQGAQQQREGTLMNKVLICVAFAQILGTMTADGTYGLLRS